MLAGLSLVCGFSRVNFLHRVCDVERYISYFAFSLILVCYKYNS